MCCWCQGYVFSLILGPQSPQISFLSWNSLSRVVEARCMQLVWEKLVDDPATLGCWTSVKSVQAMLLRCLKLQSRADKPAGEEHPYRRTLSQGSKGRPWSEERPRRPERRRGGIGACLTEISGNPGCSDQTWHTQRGLTVDPETRSSTVFMLLISTCGLFSALSIVSGLNQAFWTSPHSGPQVYRGLLAAPPWIKAQQALLLVSLFTYLPLTRIPPSAGA